MIHFLRRGVVAFGLLAGASIPAFCFVQPMPLTPAAKANVHVVRVNPVVKLPQEFLYRGRAEGAAMLLSGPLLGGFVASGMDTDVKSQLIAEMQSNHIDVGAIVAAEFASQASAGTPIAFSVGDAPADAEVALEVNVYGIGHAHSLGETLYPIVNLTATMTMPDGTVVWRAWHVASAQNLDNQDGHTLDDFVKDPELLRKAFVMGSDIVARMMAEDLVAVPKSRPGHLD